jgi:hypothetical protein
MQMLEKSMRLWFHTFWGSRVRQAAREMENHPTLFMTHASIQLLMTGSKQPSGFK